ncbi:E3 ubiquitin-protein ligase sina-like isoform X2 [Zootermopsis nevadensis]|uniref:E3 ubiquitin-protein ligase n=2 Tax=Zootermopsis nevadensis TaxID=136037 RepID=A0A067QV64_ZOONE|nr:E3 ubiquitin-protein ligase sina-like isoform X2 [Zootermopsis nevadensis]XP_021930123.1 E3 ubiquitin-protein ligase sina-like isoform X2 [Zootermopsis nevadensis]XP_021930124.1 E3 ubiquitin-protein ligase sina-like isoform X2 [Zootermopsis nevadensis]KDR14083.1 E3 ubiquitin-protein ligase sina [Zootermopsis nevadensis]
MAGLGAADDVMKSSDVDSTDSIFADGLGEELLSAMECPVCMEYMAPPIFLCENGHSICDQCRPQLSECPTCRRPFLPNTRNVALESIASRVQYPCRNEGCFEIRPLELVAQHQSACPRRPFPCPMAQGSHCTWKGPLSLIKKHVMDSHGRYVRIGAESTSVLNDVSDTPGYSLVIFAFDQVFLQKSRMQDSKFYSAVQYIGPKEHASGYRYEFQLSTAKGHQKIVVGNLVYSICEDLRQVNLHGNCVRLDHDVIKRYMYEDKLPYKLRLYRIEEDVL